MEIYAYRIPVQKTQTDQSIKGGPTTQELRIEKPEIVISETSPHHLHQKM